MGGLLLRLSAVLLFLPWAPAASASGPLLLPSHDTGSPAPWVYTHPFCTLSGREGEGGGLGLAEPREPGSLCTARAYGPDRATCRTPYRRTGRQPRSHSCR